MALSVRMGSGSPSATFMIVGEAWGETEERTGVPFSGVSGQELGRMLHDAGILTSDCYYTNLVNARPVHNDLETWIPVKKTGVTADMVPLRGRFVKPIVRLGYESLLREIELVKPKVIIPVGNSSMWALTGRTSITKWRGSMLEFNGTRVVPTYHPAAILRMWEWRQIAVLDLKRARGEAISPSPPPAYNFIIKPGFEKVLTTIEWLMGRAEGGEKLTPCFDIETVAGHIRCFAIAWTTSDAICIPLMELGNASGYWTAEEEATILWRVYKLFTHPNVGIRGQNLLYDCQYVYKHWHFIPNIAQDTMLSHHTLWAGLPKSLAFQASMYAENYVFWKEMVSFNEEKEGA